MRVFVLGAACTGKTTVCTNLRACSDLDLNVVDMNDEILSLNGGVWPDIRTKNEVLQPKVLDAVCKMSAGIAQLGAAALAVPVFALFASA